MVRVELVWVSGSDPEARAPRLAHRRLELAAGSTIRDALVALAEPGLLDALEDARLGAAVFGRARPADFVLREGDRVELLARLVADPKLSRARRAVVQRARSGDERWQRR